MMRALMSVTLRTEFATSSLIQLRSRLLEVELLVFKD